MLKNFYTISMGLVFGMVLDWTSVRAQPDVSIPNAAPGPKIDAPMTLSADVITYGNFLDSSNAKVSHWESSGIGMSPKEDTGSGSASAVAPYAPTELLPASDSALLTDIDWVARVDWMNHGQVGAAGDQSIFRGDGSAGLMWNFFRQGAGTFALNLLDTYQWYDESLPAGLYTLTTHYRSGDGQIDFYLDDSILHTENIAAANAGLKKVILRKNTNDTLRDEWGGLRVSNILPGPSNEFNWNDDISGDWNFLGNWTTGGNDPVPDNRDHKVTFGSSIQSAQTVFTNATVTANFVQFDNPNSYVVAGAGSVNLSTAASEALPNIISLQGTHRFQVSVNLQNDTSIDVASDSTLIFDGALNLMGNTLFKSGDGTLAINNQVTLSGGTVVLFQGTVRGVGKVVGDLDNDSGILSPGNSPGIMAIDGDYTQGDEGTLLIELAGREAGTQYDQLQIGGQAFLNGTLHVSIIDNFQPTLGDTFDILEFSSLVSQFDNVSLPELKGSLVWDDSALLVDGSISVVPEPTTGTLLLAVLLWCRLQTPNRSLVDQTRG